MVAERSVDSKKPRCKRELRNQSWEYWYE